MKRAIVMAFNPESVADICCAELNPKLETTLLYDEHMDQWIVNQKEKEWHDLQMDPDDLPEEDTDVEVIAKMYCACDGEYREFTIRANYSRRIIHGFGEIGWNTGYPYDLIFKPILF